MRQVPVFQQPKVAIISTGDEIVPVDEQPPPGLVRDINAFTLQALIREAGGVPEFLGLSGDNFEDLEKCRKGLEQADVVLISGGSSVGAGTSPWRSSLVSGIGNPGSRHFHQSGQTDHPGPDRAQGPLGSAGSYRLGHDGLFPFCQTLSESPGRGTPSPIKSGLKARLTRNMASAQGRDDYIRVALRLGPEGWEAAPILGKSGLISTMVRADGLIRIDRFTEGLEKGEWVEVMLF